jgi:hypothetical protein
MTATGSGKVPRHLNQLGFVGDTNEYFTGRRYSFFSRVSAAPPRFDHR